MKIGLFSLVAILAVACNSGTKKDGTADIAEPLEQTEEVIVDSEPMAEPGIPADSTEKDTVPPAEKTIPTPLDEKEQTTKNTDPRIQRILDEKLVKHVKDSINQFHSKK